MAASTRCLTPTRSYFFTSPFWGAVYVYVRDAQRQRRRQAHIRQDVRRSGESFGGNLEVSADGNTLAVLGGGRVYLFERAGGAWRQDAIVGTVRTA